ncbi:MAG: hypothetical protein ACXVPN_02235 [Bacteroidia bacterium]
MKKMILLMAGIVALSATACRKKEMPPKPPVQQTVDVALKTNQAYTFTLPKNKRNDAYEITANPQHAMISKLGADASGNFVYEYTPVSNFSGTDQVIVANDQELREHAGHPKPRPHLFPHHPRGDCANGEEEDHYVITFNFTVEPNAKTSAVFH